MHLLRTLCLLALATNLAAAAAPNVLFIAVDDLRPELACYGTRAITPNIDKLAASGLKFEHAYCNQAVCGASRVSLMTGLYPERSGERTFHVEGWRERHADVLTLNQHFKQSGFETVGLGKIYHGTGGAGVDPDNWTRWIKIKSKPYATPLSLARLAQSIANGGKHLKGPSTESAEVPDEAYADGMRAKVAIEQLQKFAAGDKPFFLAVGFTKPHLPFNAPQKYWDLYERESFKMPANSAIPPGYPAYASNQNAGELRAYSDCPKGKPADFPEAYNQKLIHGYHACVSYMDAQVGKVLDALEKSGQAENTVVVFWADHGWKLGDHSSWCKHTNFEIDTRVPLIVRAPGKTAPGTQTEALVELIDLYPTLCDLTGLEKPRHLQGESFAKILTDPKEPHRDSAYSSYPHNGGKGIGKVIGHSIRSGAYRYTEWWEAGSDKVIDAAATNLEANPGETENLLAAGAPELKQILSIKLHARVAAARSDFSAELIYPLNDKPTPECHASTIAETEDGVVAAWFGGKRERATDVGIWFARRRDGNWSKPVELVDGSEGEEKEFPCWNPVLYQVKGGPLMLFYKVGPSPSKWWGVLITSEDQGATWSKPQRLGEDEKIGHLAGPVKNKPVMLSDGKTLLCPSSSEHDGWRVHFEATADLGKTWRVIGPINDGKQFDAIQPSILFLDEKKLQILCRSQQGVITTATSEDNGNTWSEMSATEIPNPNAGTDAVTLTDGRHVLVYNPTTKKTGARGELAVAISSDGKIWKQIATLEKEAGEFSYPAIIQAADGKLHITYTYQRRSIKHVVLGL